MMNHLLVAPPAQLALYCLLVALASLAGGWILLAVRLTHLRLQLAGSFVAGLMLSMALLHFIPHAVHQNHSLDQTMRLVLSGFLAMFSRHLINTLFAFVTPLGALLFYLGVSRFAAGNPCVLGGALAFCAGTFLCIAGGGLLPEMQFHAHDRIKLSLALLLGIAVAMVVGWLGHRAPAGLLENVLQRVDGSAGESVFAEQARAAHGVFREKGQGGHFGCGMIWAYANNKPALSPALLPPAGDPAALLRVSFVRTRHVCLAAIDPFVGATERAHLRLHLLHQLECRAALVPAGPPADRAVHTNPGQHLVQRRRMSGLHGGHFIMVHALQQPFFNILENHEMHGFGGLRVGEGWVSVAACHGGSPRNGAGALDWIAGTLSVAPA